MGDAILSFVAHVNPIIGGIPFVLGLYLLILNRRTPPAPRGRARRANGRRAHGVRGLGTERQEEAGERPGRDT